MLSSSLRALILLLLVAVGCQPQNTGTVPEPVTKTGPPQVVATLSPHVWLAQQMGGDQVEVIPLLPAGADVETWSPGESELNQLAEADLIILNGSMLEKWVQRVSLPFSTLDLSRSVKDHWQEYPGIVTHSHGPEGERSWEGTDGHFWIDPSLLRLQGEAILQRLIDLVPTYEKEMRERWKSLSERISDWERRLASLKFPQGHSMVATEASWGYLAHRLKAPLTTVSPVDDENWLTAISGQSPGWILWRNAPDVDLSKQLVGQGYQNILWSPAENLGDQWQQYPQYQEQGLAALEEASATRP